MSAQVSDPAGSVVTHGGTPLVRSVGLMLLAGGLMTLLVAVLARAGSGGGPGLEPTPWLDGDRVFLLLTLGALQVFHGTWLLVLHRVRVVAARSV